MMISLQKMSCDIVLECLFIQTIIYALTVQQIQ